MRERLVKVSEPLGKEMPPTQKGRCTGKLSP
jgi:hypothetical protein